MPVSSVAKHQEAELPPATKVSYDLANLAIIIRQFLELTQRVHETYFVKRGLFNPIHDVAFGEDWNEFFQAAVQLQSQLESQLHLFERLERKPTLTEHVSLLKEQLEHYRTWFKQVRLTREFRKLGNLLESILPHKQVLKTSHANLAYAEQVLATLITLVAREQGEQENHAYYSPTA
jgi:hypothetical protein